MDSARAKELIDQFKNKKVLVVGDVALDRYVFGKVERLNPEAPVPILHASDSKRETGGAGNAAKNAAGLGADVVLIGVIGDDTAGEEVKAAAAEEGVEARLVVDESRPTIEKVRYLVKSQQMLRVDYEETDDVASDVEQKLVDAITAAVIEVDAIIVSDYAKGVVTQKVAAAIMSSGKMVMADVKPSRVKYFEGAALMSPNRKEAHEYLGLDMHDQGGESKEELAKQLREKFRATVFLTLSDEGVYVLGDDGAYHVPQEHMLEVADTSGAGDTAAVAITLAKLAGATDAEAAEIGNAAGAVNVGKVGAVAARPDELLDMISHKHG